MRRGCASAGLSDADGRGGGGVANGAARHTGSRDRRADGNGYCDDRAHGDRDAESEPNRHSGTDADPQSKPHRHPDSNPNA